MLLPVAVRAGRALRLGCENPALYSAYDLQLRRRLWYFIGILDTHSALDRGTKPVLAVADMGPAPLNINDAELCEEAAPASNKSLTDMSFTCMIHEAMICQKQLTDDSTVQSNSRKEWRRRIQLVTDFESSMRQKYYGIGPSAPSIDQLTRLAAMEIATNMQILIRRPPYMRTGYGPPPDDSFDTMKVATDILERSLQLKSPQFSQWAWKKWVKWYVLAVLLAELCAHPESAHYERSYDVACQSFEEHSQQIADGEKGMLWRPIVKLMQKVEHLNMARATNANSYTHSTDIHHRRQDTPIAAQYQSYASDVYDGGSASWLSWTQFLEDTENIPSGFEVEGLSTHLSSS